MVCFTFSLFIFVIYRLLLRLLKDSVRSFRHQHNFKPYVIPFQRLPGSSLFHLLSAAGIYIYNLLITTVSKASNQNQKQAVSWFLPFITQQQRTAVNNIIGIYLFLPPDLLPNQIPPQIHTLAIWLTKLLLQCLSQPLLVMRFSAVLLLLPPSSFHLQVRSPLVLHSYNRKLLLAHLFFIFPTRTIKDPT